MTMPATQAKTLPELIDGIAAQTPDAPALLGERFDTLSYTGLSSQVGKVADLLWQAGAQPSDRIAVVLPNGPEMAIAFLGAAACGVCAPLNPGFKEAEFRFYLEDIKARFILLSRDEQGPVRAVAQSLSLTVLEIESIEDEKLFPLAGCEASSRHRPGADDMALLLHTSGTTARPKIVPLTHANLAYSATNIGEHLALGQTDRCLNVMPLFHIHGLVGVLLASLSRGASVVCSTGFDDNAFFEQIDTFQPTWYSAVPTIHQRVVALGDRYQKHAPGHRFRFVRSSSASLPVAVFDALESLLRAPVIEAYGMTEAAHQMTSNPLPPGRREAGSVGLSAGSQVAIMNDAGELLAAGSLGQIVIRGPGVIRGYLDNPKANAAAFVHGWFLTGDQGRLDEQGRLRLTGRLKELVNRGGEKIAPLEIDEALLSYPGVAQAVAFGAPHPTLGEDLLAAVVMAPGVRLDEPALRQFLFERLAAFKVPSRIKQIDAIPKGPTGKVQRLALFGQLAGELDPAGAAPQSALELELAKAFANLLDRADIGLDHNFFRLGGDSLSGTRLMGRINENHGLVLPVDTIFRHPTVAGLAAVIAQAKQQMADEEATLLADIDALSDDEVEALLQESAHVDH